MTPSKLKLMPNQSPSPTTDQAHFEDDFAALLVDIVNTPEVRQLLADVGRHWIRDWGDRSRLKQILGKPAAWAWAKGLASSEAASLAQILQRPEHLETLSARMPQILQGLRAILLAALEALGALSADRKKTLFDHLLAFDKDDSRGSLLAGLARIAEEIYKEDPLFFSVRLTPLLDRWLGRTDVGELKALLDAGQADLNALVHQAIGLLFEYPAKLVALLSMAPDGLQLALSALHELLGHMNSLPPDIFSDLLLTLLQRVDAPLVGQTLNRANEVIRQIHTGSTLIGEMDAPRFSTDLREKLREFAAQIDPLLAVKARAALIDGRETVLRILVAAAQDRPELLNLWLEQLAAGRNAEIRLFKHKIEVIENLPADEAVEALSAGLSTWNAFDLAETVNSLGRLTNRIGRLRPDLFKSLVTEFIHTLDLYELEESWDRLAGELGGAVRPAFRRLAPPLIRELCAFFEPGEEDDGCDEAMQAARGQLRRLLGVPEEKQ